MGKIPLREKYGALFAELPKLSEAAAKIDETNIYQKANPRMLKFMYQLVEENLSEGSRIENKANFEQFYDSVCAGKRGLILMEHYSNTDLPALCYLLEHSENKKLEDLSHRIVAIAGMKLNEESPVVRAFAEGFTRVVIYPTRSLNKNEEKALSVEEAKAEEQKARKINFAAMRAMDECKKRGEVILVFPSGTRYRPGRPETKQGLREIDSYLRLFHIMILVSINGCMLDIHSDDMLDEDIGPDKMIFASSPVLDCKKFRSDILASLPQTEEDPKQRVIDNVMRLLEEQHNQIEKIR